MTEEALGFPLSFSQQRLWFLEQLVPGQAIYNIFTFVPLEGPLHRVALEQSLNEIVRRHEILRTTFVGVEGRPVQLIKPDLSLPLPIIDLSSLPRSQRDARA